MSGQRGSGGVVEIVIRNQANFSARVPSLGQTYPTTPFNLA